MQLNTYDQTRRTLARPRLNTSTRKPMLSHAKAWRPEPDGLSAAELRRIIIDQLG